MGDPPYIVRFWPDGRVDPLTEDGFHRSVRTIFGDGQPITHTCQALAPGPYAIHQRLVYASRIVDEAVKVLHDMTSIRGRPHGIEVATEDRRLAAMVSYRAFMAGNIVVFSPVFEAMDRSGGRKLRGYKVYDPIPCEGAMSSQWIGLD